MSLAPRCESGKRGSLSCSGQRPPSTANVPYADERSGHAKKDKKQINPSDGTERDLGARFGVARPRTWRDFAAAREFITNTVDATTCHYGRRKTENAAQKYFANVPDDNDIVVVKNALANVSSLPRPVRLYMIYGASQNVSSRNASKSTAAKRFGRR